MDFDLIIVNALLVTSTDITECDIAIKDEKIALIQARGTMEQYSVTRVIDADGAFVTPGGVDGHIHLDEPPLFGKGATADNFETGN
jgi:dihydropyrimidinase